MLQNLADEHGLLLLHFPNYIVLLLLLRSALLLQKLGYHIFLMQQQGYLLVLDHELPILLQQNRGVVGCQVGAPFFISGFAVQLLEVGVDVGGGLIELDALGCGVGFL